MRIKKLTSLQMHDKMRNRLDSFMSPELTDAASGVIAQGQHVRQTEDMLNTKELLYYMIDKDHDIIAGIYCVSDLVNAVSFIERGYPRKLVTAVSNHLFVLHGIRVHPHRRREGLGSDLLKKVIETADADPEIGAIRLDFDGQKQGLREFYEAHGFIINATNQQLISFPKRDVRFVDPQWDPRYKTAKLILKPEIIQIEDFTSH